MPEVEKVAHLGLLLAFYSELLTPKQKILMQRYYDEDLSLGEIADEMAISRQAVYDHLKRAVAVLEGYEVKLGLAAQYHQTKGRLTELQQKVSLLGVMLKEKALRDLNIVGTVDEISEAVDQLLIELEK